MTVAVDKRAVAAAFGRAAQTYDDFAALSAAHQDEDIDALLEALYDGCR